MTNLDPDPEVPEPDEDWDLTYDQMSGAEMVALMQTSDRALGAAARARARRAYSVVEPGDFADCIAKHLTSTDQEEMAGADLYFCHGCGRLLKSRRPVTSGLVFAHERHRLNLLWELHLGRPPREGDERLMRRFSHTLRRARAEAASSPGVS